MQKKYYEEELARSKKPRKNYQRKIKMENKKEAMQTMAFGAPDKVVSELKELATNNRRSFSAQVLWIVEEFLRNHQN